MNAQVVCPALSVTTPNVLIPQTDETTCCCPLLANYRDSVFISDTVVLLPK